MQVEREGQPHSACQLVYCEPDAIESRKLNHRILLARFRALILSPTTHFFRNRHAYAARTAFADYLSQTDFSAS